MCCFLSPHLTTYCEFFSFFFAIERVRIPPTILSSYSGAHSFVNTRPGRRNIFLRWQILSYPLQHRTVQTGRAGRRRPSTPRNGWDGIIVQLWGVFLYCPTGCGCVGFLPSREAYLPQAMKPLFHTGMYTKLLVGRTEQKSSPDAYVCFPYHTALLRATS